MLNDLKHRVFEANLELVKRNLVIYTWGNVSAIDRDEKLIVIKPSGVAYENMTPFDMVVVDLDGNVVDGHLNPSSDTLTHIELYKAFHGIGAIAHTHSTHAVAWAQACRPIPAYGTTHADHFYGPIPCTRVLTQQEVADSYEKETGKVIVEAFNDLDPMHIPGVLVGNHGPFAWGETPSKAVYNAAVLEEIARMAWISEQLGVKAQIPDYILDKHFKRKHGKDAYYGQK